MARTAGSARKTPSIRFPEGFRELTATFYLKSGRVDFSSLVTQYRADPEFSIRPDNKALFGSLKGQPGWGNVHAHITITQDRPEAEVTEVEFELIASKHGRFAKNAITVDGFLTDLSSRVSPNREAVALLGAEFGLSGKQWQPTFPLPFAAPSGFDHIPGVPQISGIDLSFESSTPEPSLNRAFVTTYKELNSLRVRFLATQTFKLDTSIVPVMCEVAEKLLPVFAKKVKT